ncbi:MAG: M23 family metallopeptidase [Balneolaceae bacterium]|nr:M23 family metallopeptidase [Balneolaceae bacterium]
MIEFLKKLIHFRDSELTVILLDDEEPESTHTYRIKPSQLFGLFYLTIATMVLILLVLVIFTPLGSLVYDKEDEQLRNDVIQISQRVEALQDSLETRDRQLSDIQRVLAGDEDTTFAISGRFSTGELNRPDPEERELLEESEVRVDEMISKNEIIFSSVLNRAPEFPAPYPVEGRLTRGFNQETGHFGIDIAARKESQFKAIADGTVINSEWTVNYGYVLYIQHNAGIISVYKHASSVSKEVGDMVFKGDILGTVGDTGVLSSGPHLHLEIWNNGVPQDPIMYLLKS